MPGFCEGLLRGIEGMKIGGTRTVRFPPSLGFGDRPAIAPYGILPAGSTVRYEIELVRLSAVGPDALRSGIAKCGQGGAAQQTEACRDIEPAEFL